MPITRTEKAFCVIPGECVTDATMDAEMIGVLCFIYLRQSVQDDQVLMRFPDLIGRHRRIIKALIELGYVSSDEVMS